MKIQVIVNFCIHPHLQTSFLYQIWLFNVSRQVTILSDLTVCCLSAGSAILAVSPFKYDSACVVTWTFCFIFALIYKSILENGKNKVLMLMILQSRQRKVSFGMPRAVNLMLIEFKKVWQLCSIVKENHKI